jgi:hypothetical protein
MQLMLSYDTDSDDGALDLIMSILYGYDDATS